MKRILSLLLILACFVLLLGSCGKKDADAETTAPDTTAQETTAATTVKPADPQTVFVTISNKNGEAVLKLAEITATDLDADGKVTIYEALKAAHATCPNGGADGFAAIETEIGLSMSKLWGEDNGVGYGYYQNEAAAWALTDEVHTGDRIVAFSYTDTAFYTDAFCYFTPMTATKNAGENVELTLIAIFYDEAFAPVPTPIEGAKIFVNGVDSGLTTNAEGKVTLTLESGVNEISATSETTILVPPIAKITIE